MKVRFLTSVPAAVYSYRFPKKLQQASGKDGAHVFFFKAHLETNSVKDLVEASIDRNIVEAHQWLTREEFQALMIAEKQKKYFNAINSSMLFESVDQQFIERVLTQLRNSLTKDENVREAVALK